MQTKKTKTFSHFTKHNQAVLVRSGKPYFELLIRYIKNAANSICLQTYIFTDDETGRLVARALMDAARRNVAVYLLVDGYASQQLSKRLVCQLREAGVHFKSFQPLIKSSHYYFGRRLHHKLLVVDNRYALIGGINIADRYNDTDKGAAWLDFAISVEGELVNELCTLCHKTWNNFLPSSRANLLVPEQPYNNKNSKENVCLRMRRNDWVRRKNEISASYINMLRNAESHITIVCSYFLPGKTIRKMLKQAALRGVLVKVVTTRRSDIPISKFAERWMYDWLLRNNIQLYEYCPTILHAKIACCDNEFVTVGSYNINNISAYASIELNIDVWDKPFGTATNEIIEKIIKEDCIAITSQYQKSHKNPLKQFLGWVAYRLIALVLYLFTFYFKREKITPSSGSLHNK